MALMAAAGTRALIPYLMRRALDRPNERSSHTRVTPRGAGLALIPIAAAGWVALATLRGDGNLAWAAIGALALCAVSWSDDRASLSPLTRLAAHIIVVGALLGRLPPETLHFQGLLPLWADRIAAALVWLWFINLFNFMDGIDGISGIETAAIGLGVAALAVTAGAGGPLVSAGATLAGIAVGFLWLNWPPAKVFLGDAGSVPLGLMLGWLLLDLAARGLWLPALILALYYFADATLTLARRALRGERVWRAHRQHFYQRAVARGLSHAQVSTLVGAADVLLIGAALLAQSQPVVAIVVALVVTGGLLLLLNGKPGA
jgi:UDP-N-acetylmuramyl pentapeptide phosphotransferase/UDP-N-acetylglucosamine-1-phosphate transferase